RGSRGPHHRRPSAGRAGRGPAPTNVATWCSPGAHLHRLQQLLHLHHRAGARTLDRAEDQGRGLQVGLDLGLERFTAADPAREALDQPGVEPFWLGQQLDLLALALAVALARQVDALENLDLAAVEHRAAELAVDTDIFARPVVEAHRRARRAFE